MNNNTPDLRTIPVGTEIKFEMMWAEGFSKNGTVTANYGTYLIVETWFDGEHTVFEDRVQWLKITKEV